VARFSELGPDEVSDLWHAAQRVGNMIQAHFSADSLTLSLQDGPAAGQTVPHVHIHVLPRHFRDLEQNDDIYDLIDASDQRRPADGVSRAAITLPHRSTPTPGSSSSSIDEGISVSRSAPPSPRHTPVASPVVPTAHTKLDTSAPRVNRTAAEMTAEADAFRTAMVSF
jgi:hypothetical protein